MTNLSVNINKIATLRNARGENRPDVVQWAIDVQRLGAQGVTVHPRPDERHIRRRDVYDLRPKVTTEFNIEGYPSPEFLDLVCQVRPEQVTLVPDKPGQLTTNAGWDTVAHHDFLVEVIERLKGAGIRTSVFVDPDPEMIKGAAAAGADRVELYTKAYADNYAADREAAVAPYVKASQAARAAGLGVNAGHDLSLDNLEYFAQQLPYLNEVSIGHALVCDALYLGIAETIHRYRQCLNN